MLPILFAAGAAAALFLSGCSKEEEIKISPDPSRVPYPPRDRSKRSEETFHRGITYYRVDNRATYNQWVNQRNLLSRKIDLFYRQGERAFDIYVSREDQDTIVYILNQKKEEYPDLKLQVFYFNPKERQVSNLPEKDEGRRILVF